MSRLDATGVALVLLTSCTTNHQTSEHPSTEPTTIASCTSDWGPSRDELGRLVTGPGLCRVVGVSKRTSPPGTDVVLQLSYDGYGRPLSAIAEFSAHCGEVGPAGMPITDPQCWTYELHEQRWAWDELGRLTGAELAVTIGVEPESFSDDADELGAHLGDDRCLLGADLVVVDAATWSYDPTGRVQSYRSEFHDCTDAEIRTETLAYFDSLIEANLRVDDAGASTSHLLRYRLDDCGHVVAIEGSVGEPKAGSRYEYDAHGRLTVADDGPTEHRWTYEAGVVASSQITWTSDYDHETRTLLLTKSPGGDRFEIRLDHLQRVVSLDSDDESWTLEYGGCDNSQFATTRWRVGEILTSWSFADPPQPGEGLTALDVWTHASLPLLPFAG